MVRRTRMVLAAAVVAACGGVVGTRDARAAAPAATRPAAAANAAAGSPTAAPGPVGQTPSQLPPVATAAPAVAARSPLMSLLDSAGVGKPLDDARIRVYGHVEGSYTYNFAHPPTELADYKLGVGKFIDNPGRTFDVENQKILLNQLTLNVERTVDAADAARRQQFDVGGRVELLYGSDARFIHANGLLDNYDDDATVRVTGGPLNQFDLPNAYVDLALPVGNGLSIRAGRFTFFKQIDPNYSPFYSHSFTFGGALPFTLTGAYATYVVNDQLTVDAGVSRGWDQALDDNNGSIDVFGRLRYQATDQLRFVLAAITGPEQTGDNGNYRTAVDFTAAYEPNDKLTLLADLIYGQQAQPAGGSGTSHWYGVSVYAVQELTKELSTGVRLEVYRDDGGFTTGVDQTLYEATVGVTIRPFANDRYLQFLKIRPEVRLDYSTENYFDGFDSHYQITAAVDAIFNF
jgi:hypothetical protein